MLGSIPPDAAGARRKWPSRVMNPVLSTQSPSSAARNPGHERNRARISSECDPQPTHAATPHAPHAQSAVHLGYNSPFSPVLTKVDDGLSTNPTTHRQLRGQTWGFCDHRPPTRRRHAARSLLWSQFPPHLRVGTYLEPDHIGRDTPNTTDTSRPICPKHSPPPPRHEPRARISSECDPQPTHAATPRTPLAQSTVHLSYNSPFSPVLTKVDDGLSSKPKLRPS